MASKIRNWVVATALVCLMALAGGWFLLISPQMAAEAETQEYTLSESARTVALTAQLAKLKEQFANIDTYRTDLAGLQKQIPSAVGMDSFFLEVQRIADASGVSVQSATAGAPAAPEVPVAPVPAPTGDGAATTDGEVASPAPTDSPETAATDTTAVAPAVNAAGSNVVAIPVSFTVVGSYAATASFLEALQTDTTRLFLVGGFAATTQDEAAATSARPATAPGDVELAVDGFLYVLPMTAPVTDDDGTATPAPMPASERNPFAPIG